MRVRAKEVCFIDNRLRREGEVFDYEGTMYRFIEPVDPPKQEVDEPTSEAEPAPAVVKRGPGRPKKNQTAGT